MSSKNYNSISQKKLDLFITFLIKEKIVLSKFDFAKKIKESKENLNNIIFRNKILNEEKAILIATIFEINPLYFTDDSINISTNPLKDHPSLSKVEKNYENQINDLNKTIDDMNNKIIQLEQVYKNDKDVIIKEYITETSFLWSKIKYNLNFFVEVANRINELNVSSNWIKLLKEKLKDILSYFLNCSIKDTYKLINDTSNMISNFDYIEAYKSYTSMVKKMSQIDSEHQIIIHLEKYINETQTITDVYNVYDNKVLNILFPLQDEIEELIIKNILPEEIKNIYIQNIDFSFLDLDYIYSVNMMISYKNFICGLINYPNLIQDETQILLKKMIIELKNSVYNENNEFALPSLPKTAEKLYLNLANNILNYESFIDEINKNIEIVDKNILICKETLEKFHKTTN